jgi:hypothetical protein
MSQAAGRASAGRTSGRRALHGSLGRNAALLATLVAIPTLLGGSVLGGSASAASITPTVNASWTPYKPCPGQPKDNCAAVRTMTRTPNGTIFLGGDFTSLRSPDFKNSRPVSNIAAINDAGNPVTSVKLPTFNAPVLSLVNDGNTVYAGGSFTKMNGAGQYRVGRFSATTGARLTFFAGVNGDVHALALQGPGLYIGGNFTNVQGASHLSLAALNSGTGVVYSFFNGGAAVIANSPSPNDAPHNNTPIRALLATSTRIYAAGDMDYVDGFVRPGLVALNPLSGAIDGSFQPMRFISTATQGEALLAVPASGSNPAGIVISAGGLYNFAIRLDLTGNFVWGVTGDGDFQTAAVIGSTIYLGGHFTCISPASANCFQPTDVPNVPRMHIAAFSVTGSGILSPDPSFKPWMGPETEPYFYGVQTLLSSGSSLYAGGVWKSIGVGSKTYTHPKYVRFGPAAS